MCGLLGCIVRTLENSFEIPSDSASTRWQLGNGEVGTGWARETLPVVFLSYFLKAASKCSTACRCFVWLCAPALCVSVPSGHTSHIQPSATGFSMVLQTLLYMHIICTYANIHTHVYVVLSDLFSACNWSTGTFIRATGWYSPVPDFGSRCHRSSAGFCHYELCNKATWKTGYLEWVS